VVYPAVSFAELEVALRRIEAFVGLKRA
jgi:hypothetical protein